MNLPGACALASHLDLPQVAVRHADSSSAFAEAAKVDVERTRAVKLTQGADAVANAAGQDAELRLSRQLLIALQFRWRQELHAYLVNRVARRVQVQLQRRDVLL